MNTNADKDPTNDVWLPPPTFRPNTDKSTHHIPSVRASLLIGAVASISESGYRAWNSWWVHQKINWLGDVAFQGFIVFTLVAAAHHWVLPWIGRKTENWFSRGKH